MNQAVETLHATSLQNQRDLPLLPQTLTPLDPKAKVLATQPKKPIPVSPITWD